MYDVCMYVCMYVCMQVCQGATPVDAVVVAEEVVVGVQAVVVAGAGVGVEVGGMGVAVADNGDCNHSNWILYDFFLSSLIFHVVIFRWGKFYNVQL